MNRTKRIKTILVKHFSNFNINIVDNSNLHKGHNNFSGDGETHILVNLKTKSQSRIDRMEIHKKINSLIKEEFKKGLHALEIKISVIE